MIIHHVQDYHSIAPCIAAIEPETVESSHHPRKFYFNLLMSNSIFIELGDNLFTPWLVFVT